jgi:hypothetical protein
MNKLLYNDDVHLKHSNKQSTINDANHNSSLMIDCGDYKMQSNLVSNNHLND